MNRKVRLLILLMLTGAVGIATAQIQGTEQFRSMVRSSVSDVADGSNGKCGTAFRMAWRAEHLAARSGVDGVWDERPVRQFTRPSPSGHFRLHYDTLGIHAPALLDAGGDRINGSALSFVDSAAAILDRAWERIVTGLGYDPPPADSGGGDVGYDVYLSELPPDWFGQTVLESTIPGSTGQIRWSSYLEIDNDFAGLRTPGLNGLRITAAHEFFHAIQVGAYGVWDDDDFYFYELASVWMETVVEPGIDDYLFDLPSYFSGFSGKSLTTLTSTDRGYERAIFAFFLEERFGREAMRDIWRTIRTTRLLPALEAALAARGSGLKEAFREFALWNHRTRDRAAGAVTYRHADRFPRMTPSAVITWSPPSIRLAAMANALSHSTFDIRFPADTLSALVINADVGSIERGTNAPQTISLTAANTAPNGGSQRIGDLWLSIDVPRDDDWTHEVLSAARRDAIPPAEARPWPSPWVLSEDADLVLPLGTLGAPESVQFLSAAERVTSVERWSLETQRATPVARIPVGPMRTRLSSGVYVVVLKNDEGQQLWKIAVVR